MRTTVRTGRLVAGRLPLICATAFALTGCAAMHRDEARNTGDILVAAGFTQKPADTPERARKLQEMPPLKMISQTKDGRMVYRYADPYSCSCLYVGDQKAYGQYVSLARQNKIAEERLEATETEEDAAALDWGFGGPWENSN